MAWVVNAIVNVLSGEKRNDTGSLWIDIVLRIFAARDFGITARILNYLARQGWPLKLLYLMERLLSSHSSSAGVAIDLDGFGL